MSRVQGNGFWTFWEKYFRQFLGILEPGIPTFLGTSAVRLLLRDLSPGIQCLSCHKVTEIRSQGTKLSGTFKYVVETFGFFVPKTILLALFLGKRGPPCENIDRDLHFAPVVGPF